MPSSSNWPRSGSGGLPSTASPSVPVPARARCTRWPDTTALVIDTLETLGMDPAGYVRTGVLRTDLIGFTRYMTSTHQGVRVRHSVACWRSPPLSRASRPIHVSGPGPLFDTLTELLRDAAKRGEVSSKRLTPVVLEVLHALIIKRMLLETRDLTTKDITEMIDQILLPLVVA